MSPLDDELMTTLRDRAASLPPSPDPLAGIERRAARIRRRRLAAALSGAALVVAAAAVSIPSLVSGSPTVRLTPATQGPTAAPDAGQPPANVLSTWPQRGASARAPQLTEVVQAFAQAMNRSADVADAEYRQLFVGDTGRGEAFTIGQAWFHGDVQAYDVAYTTGARDSRGALTSEFFLGRATPAHPAVLAYVVPNLAGMSDLLVVVPQPTTGQVLYSPDASTAFTPITGQDRYDGVVLVDRAVTASNDRLELLDGNGNQDAPTYKGPVAPLVCGLKECG